jgi:hypothetical protein
VTTLTAEDLAVREGRITSTRIVKLYRGEALAVFNDMNGLARPFKDSARPAWGRRLQGAIVEGAAEREGWKTIAYPPTLASAMEPRFATSVDAVADLSIAVEAKNRGGERASIYADGPMEEEIVQTCWHQGVLGLPKGAICVLLGGNDLRVFPLDFDADMFDGLAEIARRFLRDHVDTGRAPPIDYSDSSTDFLRARFPKESGRILDATPELTTLVSAVNHARKAKKAAEQACALAENTLKLALGDASGVKGPGFSVTWKTQKGSTYSVTREPGRVLRVKCDAEENGNGD